MVPKPRCFGIRLTSTTHQAGRAEAPGALRWLKRLESRGKGNAVGCRSCRPPCSGWWYGSRTHFPRGRALSWALAWICPVPPQGSQLPTWRRRMWAGLPSIPMCPPAPSLGHRSSKEEGSRNRAVSILQAPGRCPSVCNQCRSQARSLLFTAALSVCQAPRRMTTKEAASVSWMGKLRLRVTEPGVRSLHLSPTPHFLLAHHEPRSQL